MAVPGWAAHIASMRYRRSFVAGGTYFFTVNLEDRGSQLLVDHAYLLKQAVRLVKDRHPFDVVAWSTMPDHLHAVLTLPDGDADFAMRWSLIKANFSRSVEKAEIVSKSRAVRRERGIWQRRFWEHLIRDDRDLQRHVDYVHFNPVKHGLVERAADWPYSSFHRHVRQGHLPAEWGSRESSEAPRWGERRLR